MKLDLRGIRFRVWLVVFILAVGITLFIAVLQTEMIRPYYRDSKTSAVKMVADEVQKDLIDASPLTETGVKDALQEAVDNNVCIVIYNDQGKVVYNADSLGTACIFNMSSYERPEGYRTILGLKSRLAENDGEFSENLENSRTDQEMIVYGREIRQDLATYYLFVNSPLEPIDSIVSFFRRQYLYYAVIVLLAASVVSFFIASSISKPILKMNHEAGKLASGDYEVNFDGGGYTETKALARTLNTAADQLSRIEEMRRDLIANVSHDIRTPLTDIRAYAEMIRDISGGDEKKRTKHLDVIIRETEYMSRLVNDMSELSKLQSGNYELNLSNFDLSESVREIADVNAGLLERNGLKLDLQLDDTLTVYGDEIKIDQVISNYLSNAIKHSPSGSTITVKAYRKKDEETARVEVIDEGEGIAAEDLPHIWDRYQKYSGSFSRNMQSTGLGLAIVKAILEAHGAQFGVQSEVGKGSLFWFELQEHLS